MYTQEVKEKRYAYTREWRLRNKEYVVQYNKQYKDTHKEIARDRVREYRKTPKGAEEHRQESKQFYHAHREYVLNRLKTPEVRARRKIYDTKRKAKNPHRHLEYYRKNKEMIDNKRRKWFKNHPYASKIYNQKRRNYGDLKLEDVQKAYEENIKVYNRLTCILCEKPIIFGDDSIEHKTPLSRGGTHEYPNLAIAHKSCNFIKNTKTLEEWRMIHE